MVKEEPVWKRGLLDLSAFLFLIGGVIGLVSVIMMIPISTVHPFRLTVGVSFVLIVVLIVGAICADGIRPALMEKTDLSDAKFMLIACSAFVNYLVSKSSRAGIRFN